jgi:hypothetical protein
MIRIDGLDSESDWMDEGWFWFSAGIGELYPAEAVRRRVFPVFLCASAPLRDKTFPITRPPLENGHEKKNETEHRKSLTEDKK